MTCARPRRWAFPIVLAPLLVLQSGCDALLESKPELSIAPAEAAKPEVKAAPEPVPVVAPEQAKPVVLEPKLDPKTGTTPEVPATTPQGHIQDEQNTIDVFGAAAPATVFITQKQVVVDRFSMREYELPAGSGTGYIWDAQGHIVTNCHVAMLDCKRGAKPASLSVTLYDQKSYDAVIVGHDPYHDIAVLKIVAAGVTLVPVRRPEKGYALVVGQKTIAIGNPFGLDHTLTVGVISALGREVKGIGDVTIRGMVQTDAAINPGNSGGPLLDSRGQVIGMNTMIFSTSGSAAGIGFAVPISTIERVVPQIIATGGPERIGLGITIVPEELVPRIRKQLRIELEGVIIETVAAGSPAEKAGLRPPEVKGEVLQLDVVVGIDDQRVRNFDELYGAIEGKSEGDTVKVSVRRFPADKVEILDVTLVKLATR